MRDVESEPSNGNPLPTGHTRLIDDLLSLFFPYQLVWCLCCQYQCDCVGPCCLDVLIPSLSNKSCLQCWNLSLNLVQDPPCTLCTRQSECCSQCLQLERFSDYRDLKTAKKCTKDPAMPCSIAASDWNALLPSKVAHSPQWLRMQEGFKEVMRRRVPAVMDSSFVFTSPFSQATKSPVNQNQVFVIKPGYFHAEVMGFYWILLQLCLKMIMLLPDNGAVFWEEESNKPHQCLVA